MSSNAVLAKPKFWKHQRAAVRILLAPDRRFIVSDERWHKTSWLSMHRLSTRFYFIHKTYVPCYRSNPSEVWSGGREDPGTSASPDL